MRLMGKVGFAVAATGLAVGSVLGAGSANAAGLYAAIAVSEDRWTYGVAVDVGSFEEARDIAIADCGGGDCEVAAAWANGCAAIIESPEGVVVASGPTRADAERAAYERIATVTPTAHLANVGSAQLSGTTVVDVICTANAR